MNEVQQELVQHVKETLVKFYLSNIDAASERWQDTKTGYEVILKGYSNYFTTEDMGMTTIDWGKSRRRMRPKKAIKSEGFYWCVGETWIAVIKNTQKDGTTECFTYTERNKDDPYTELLDFVMNAARGQNNPDFDRFLDDAM